MPACDYNRAGMEKAAFYSYQPGMTLRVAKVEPAEPATSKDKPRPIFVVADSSVPQLIRSLEDGGEDSTSEEMEDSGDDEPDIIFEDDVSDVDIGEDPEDDGNVFAFNADSDDEEDPDQDSLQEYLAKQARKKKVSHQRDERPSAATKRPTKVDTKQDKGPKKKFKK